VKKKRYFAALIACQMRSGVAGMSSFAAFRQRVENGVDHRRRRSGRAGLAGAFTPSGLLRQATRGVTNTSISGIKLRQSQSAESSLSTGVRR